MSRMLECNLKCVGRVLLLQTPAKALRCAYCYRLGYLWAGANHCILLSSWVSVGWSEPLHIAIVLGICGLERTTAYCHCLGYLWAGANRCILLSSWVSVGWSEPLHIAIVLGICGLEQTAAYCYRLGYLWAGANHCILLSPFNVPHSPIYQNNNKIIIIGN